MFDSSDDEEEFLGFTREDIPLRGEESDSNSSGESDISLSETTEEEVAKNRKMKMQTKTCGVKIYEMR